MAVRLTLSVVAACVSVEPPMRPRNSGRPLRATYRSEPSSVMVAVSKTDHIIERMAEVASRMVPGKDIGPVISVQAKERIERYITEAEDAGATVLVDGPGPSLCFQEMAERGAGKNRIHLDVTVADRRARVARLCALGGSLRREAGAYTVMADPEGNTFCVVQR